MPKFGSRVDGVGGRRHTPRRPILLSASLESISDYRQIELIDISATGAKVRGTDLPDCGSDVLLKVGCVEAFSEVVWVSENLRGLHFDEPVEKLLLDRLGREGHILGSDQLTLEERTALEHWKSGHAR